MYYTDEKFIEISWLKNRAHNCTTGWLLSEVLRNVIDKDSDWYDSLTKANYAITALEARR